MSNATKYFFFEQFSNIREFSLSPFSCMRCYGLSAAVSVYNKLCDVFNLEYSEHVDDDINK
jgi:hypothetical protein